MTERRASSANGHSHVEAFCLMRYGTRDGSVVEFIWNSRDGVTPFIVHTREGVEMSHLPPWSDDVYAPEHRPMVGDRIFVDLTLESARKYRRAYVDRWWSQGKGESKMSSRFASKDDAVEKLARADMESGGGLEPPPDLVEVTAEMAKERGWTLTEDEIATVGSLSSQDLEAKLVFKLREATLAKKLERAAVAVAENMGVPIEQARKGLQELVAAARADAKTAPSRVPLHDARGSVIGSVDVAGDGTARLNITDPTVTDDLRRASTGVSVGYNVIAEDPVTVGGAPAMRLERTLHHAQVVGVVADVVAPDLSPRAIDLGGAVEITELDIKASIEKKLIKNPNTCELSIFNLSESVDDSHALVDVGAKVVDWRTAEQCGEAISRVCLEARLSVDQSAAKREVAANIAMLLIALDLGYADVDEAAGRK